MLLARDGSLSAVHLPPAQLSARPHAPADSATAALLATPVATPSCDVPSGCMGHSLEFLPGAGLMVATLGPVDASKASWLLSGYPVSDGSFLSDVSVTQQLVEEVWSQGVLCLLQFLDVSEKGLQHSKH